MALLGRGHAQQVLLLRQPEAVDVTLALTGVAATGGVGSLAAAITLTLAGVSGSGSPGSLGIGASLTGVSAVTAAGTLTPSITVTLSGVAGSGAVGTLLASGGDTTVALTGVVATGGAGTLVPGITKAISGVLGTGEVGILYPGGAVIGCTIDSPIILTPLIIDALMQAPVLGVALATSVKVDAGGFIASDSSPGVDASVTTGGLVGKTMTFKDGLLVDFS